MTTKKVVPPEVDVEPESDPELLRVLENYIVLDEAKTAADNILIRQIFTDAGSRCQCTSRGCHHSEDGRCPQILEWSDRGKANGSGYCFWEALPLESGNFEIVCVPCQYARSPRKEL